MPTFKIDALYLLITAVVALPITAAIVFLAGVVHPGLIAAPLATGLFIYIGVFAAILLIEFKLQRLERRR